MANTANTRESAIEAFVRYSVNYQIKLARYVADLKTERVYIFDASNFFDKKEDCVVETVVNVATLTKHGKRAVLSVAVRSAFGTNSDMFLSFVDHVDAVREDDIGIYLEPTTKRE